MAFTANAGIVSVERGAVAAAVEALELVLAEHLEVASCSSFGAGVAVLVHLETLGLHHAREAQGLAGESAVAELGGGLGVEDADEVETHQQVGLKYYLSLFLGRGVVCGRGWVCCGCPVLGAHAWENQPCARFALCLSLLLRPWVSE